MTKLLFARYLAVGQVLKPNTLYSGQKLTTLVKIKIVATIYAAIAQPPVIPPVKAETPNINAIIALTLRSILPIFVFIILNFFDDERIAYMIEY
jgi:hypothetical protein